jgi:hypothetical protein
MLPRRSRLSQIAGLANLGDNDELDKLR